MKPSATDTVALQSALDVNGLSARKPELRRGRRLHWDPVRGQFALLGPESAALLSPTAAEILRRCDGVRSIADIARALHERYGTPGIDADVIATLQRLEDGMWLQLRE